MGNGALPVRASRFVVDFADPIASIQPWYVGLGCSMYGRIATTSTEQAAAERALDARYMRLPVKWDGTQAVSAAAGSAATPIKPLVDLYRSWGYHVHIIISGRDGDFANYVSGDAAAIVGQLGTDSSIEYSGPNEPWLDGATTQDVIDRGIVLYDELQTVAAGKKLWGPVHYAYVTSDLEAYMDGMGAARIDGVEYHNYAMGSTALATQVAFAQTSQYEQQVGALRLAAQQRAIDDNVAVSELNFSWRSNDGTPEEMGGFVSPKSGQLINGRLFTAVNTVWMASAIGHILAAGGRAIPYANQNQALGIMVQNDYTGDTGDVPGANGVQRANSSPMPAYWGIAAWTGAGEPDLSAEPSAQTARFSHFNDTMYRTELATGDTDIEVFALNNESGGYNLVAINKHETSSCRLTIELSNATVTVYDAWMSRAGAYPAAFTAPRKVATGQPITASTITLALDACTVSTIVLS